MEEHVLFLLSYTISYLTTTLTRLPTHWMGPSPKAENHYTVYRSHPICFVWFTLVTCCWSVVSLFYFILETVSQLFDCHECNTTAILPKQLFM